MPDPKPRRLEALLASQTGRLGVIADRAKRLAAFERAALDGLDPDLTPHCRLVGLGPARAVIAVDSPAWATRLRYHTAEIREKLRSAGHPVRECRVIVATGQVPARPEGQARRPVLNEDAAATLKAAADGITDEALATALRKLAGNSQRQA